MTSGNTKFQIQIDNIKKNRFLANISDTPAQFMGHLHKICTHEYTHQPNYITSSLELPENVEAADTNLQIGTDRLLPPVTTAYHQKDITSSKPSLNKGSTKPTFSLLLLSHNTGCTCQLLCESVLSTIAHSVQEERGQINKAAT